MEKRKLGICVNPACGKETFIAAHGLCYACFRFKERNPFAPSDRHNRALIKAQQAQRKALMKLLDALEGVADILTDGEVVGIKATLKPYLAQFVEALPDTGTTKEALHK
jgi:hypothetical protein